jgi:hypothetical protein
MAYVERHHLSERHQLSHLFICPHLSILLLYCCRELSVALAADPDWKGEVFALLQQIDTGGFVGAGRDFGGGLFKREPAELGAIPAEPILELLQAQPFRLVAGYDLHHVLSEPGVGEDRRRVSKDNACRMTLRSDSAVSNHLTYP